MLTVVRSVFVFAFLWLALPVQAQTKPAAPANNGKFPAYPTDLKFTPGKEIRVEDPQTVKAGLSPTDNDPTNFFTVYIPKDYDPSRSFPVILNYHGMNSDPNSWPFKDQTGGKGYIIIGMEYLRPACFRIDPNYEIGYVQRLLAWLKTNVNVDTKMIFMSGFSQGGWHTAGTCDKFAESLAGIIICSAGRGATGPKINAYNKMPVLITAGEKEANRASAESAAQYFKSQGSEVTLCIFKGLDHTIDVGSADMKQWLKDNGPARQSRLSFANAEKAKKDNQLGQAYTLYAAIAKNPDAGEFKEKADTAAQEIAADAQKKLDEAEALIAARKYPEARRAFAPLMTAYAGSTFADTAKSKIAYLDKDPAIAADKVQAALDAKADQIEEMAKAAEAKKDFSRAISLYESYVSTCAKAHRIEEVKKHLAELKADPTIVIAAKNADPEAKLALDKAREMSLTSPEKARPMLQDIIKKYPDSDWAIRAKTILDSMK